MRSGEETLVNSAVDGSPNWFNHSKTGLVQRERKWIQTKLTDESNHLTKMKPILNGKTKYTQLNAGQIGNHVGSDVIKMDYNSSIGLNGKTKSSLHNKKNNNHIDNHSLHHHHNLNNYKTISSFNNINNVTNDNNNSIINNNNNHLFLDHSHHKNISLEAECNELTQLTTTSTNKINNKTDNTITIWITSSSPSEATSTTTTFSTSPLLSSSVTNSSSHNHIIANDGLVSSSTFTIRKAAVKATPTTVLTKSNSEETDKEGKNNIKESVSRRALPKKRKKELSSSSSSISSTSSSLSRSFELSTSKCLLSAVKRNETGSPVSLVDFHNDADHSLGEQQKQLKHQKQQQEHNHLHSNHLHHHNNKYHHISHNHHHHFQEDLFQAYSIFSSSCDEDESIASDVKPLPSLTMSHRMMITQDLKMSDIRNQLISHKFLLTNLIKVKESEVRNLVKATKQKIKREGLFDEFGRSHLDKILEASRETRISSKFSDDMMSIRKGICCFEDDLNKCDKPSLPFSRHCRRHILYNVDQLLFVRCTAKDSDTLAQCSNPSLDVLQDEPLCPRHMHTKNLSTLKFKDTADDAITATANGVSSLTGGGGKGKGKGKTGQGPGRPGRRSKKRRKIATIGNSKGQTFIGGSIDSIDSSSFISQDSSGSPFINSENCDSTQVHLSAIKIEPNEINSSVTTLTGDQHHQHQNLQQQQPNQTQNCIASVISQSTSSFHSSQQQQQQQLHHPSQPSHFLSVPNGISERNVFDVNLPVISSTTSLSTSPSTLLRPRLASLTQPVTTTVSLELSDTTRNRMTLPCSLDVGATSFAPSDEALVASLVAELPPLCAENGPEPEAPSFVDADLTDVLNKIPDDAFNDLFVDNLKNGELPSKEESEALEQAIAAVSKNVQYLSVAAAAAAGSRPTDNSTTTRTGGGAGQIPSTHVTVATTVINDNSNYYHHQHSTQHHHHNQHHHHHHTSHPSPVSHHHHTTLNGEIPQSTPQAPLTQHTALPQTQPSPQASQPPPTSSLPSQPQSSSLVTSSHHELQNRAASSNNSNSISSTAPNLQLNDDILGLANNILTSLTTEQQQQLNGLIDGALASGTLTSSPTLKSALASLSNLAQEGEISCESHL